MTVQYIELVLGVSISLQKEGFVSGFITFFGLHVLDNDIITSL